MTYQVTLQNINNIAIKLRKLFQIESIISLNGPMGSGKTTLLKAILKEYTVQSPSFLHALYYGEKFIHIDAYTTSKEQFLNLCIEDSIHNKCIIIEWGDILEEIIQDFITTKIKINMLYNIQTQTRFIKIYKNGKKINLEEI